MFWKQIKDDFFARIMLAVLIALPIQAAIRSIQASDKYQPRDVALVAKDEMARHLEAFRETNPSCLGPRIAGLLATLPKMEMENVFGRELDEANILTPGSAAKAIARTDWPSVHLSIRDSSFGAYSEQELRELGRKFCIPRVERFSIPDLRRELQKQYGLHEVGYVMVVQNLRVRTEQRLQEHTTLRVLIGICLVLFLVVHSWHLFRALMATPRDYRRDDGNKASYLLSVVMVVLLALITLVLLGVSFHDAPPYRNSILNGVLLFLVLWTVYDFVGLCRSYYEARHVPKELRGGGSVVNATEVLDWDQAFWPVADTALLIAFIIVVWSYDVSYWPGFLVALRDGVFRLPQSASDLEHLRYAELWVIGILCAANMAGLWVQSVAHARRRRSYKGICNV